MLRANIAIKKTTKPYLENQIKPMCNLDRSKDAQVLKSGLNLISKLIESEGYGANQPQVSTSVLTVATQAYASGKITKNQYIAVINALDESPQTVDTRAYVEHPNNREYLRANAYLNQYRGRS